MHSFRGLCRRRCRTRDATGVTRPQVVAPIVRGHRSARPSSERHVPFAREPRAISGDIYRTMRVLNDVYFTRSDSGTIALVPVGAHFSTSDPCRWPAICSRRLRCGLCGWADRQTSHRYDNIIHSSTGRRKSIVSEWPDLGNSADVIVASVVKK